MFRKFVLLLGVVVAGYVSYLGLVAPEAALGDYGVIAMGPDGRNEIRAQYGGFYFAVAVVLILSAAGRLPERFGLGLLLVSVGGVLLGRLASLVIEGPAIFAQYSDGLKLFYAVDIVLVLLAVMALMQKR
ncbi:MAG: DUF4345 family protein [Pseudomonadota bacterium]